MIKEYFANYSLHSSNITFDMKTDTMEVHQYFSDPWRITLVDTGYDTATGGRLKCVRPFIGDDDFCFTYGDGVSDVNIRELIEFHITQNRLATVTAVCPPNRFGRLSIDDTGKVGAFQEKPVEDGGWINGGFFVLSPKVIDYIKGPDVMWEHDPLKNIARDGQLSAFQHRGFWHSMDTLRDNQQLNQKWRDGQASWNVW